MKVWPGIVILLIVALCLSGCGVDSSVENDPPATNVNDENDVKKYLEKAEPIMTKIGSLDGLLFKSIYRDNVLESDDAVHILTTYKRQYDILLQEFQAERCPEEAHYFKQYTVQMLNKTRQAVDELINYCTTDDLTYRNNAENSLVAANESRERIVAEWKGLRKIAGMDY